MPALGHGKEKAAGEEGAKQTEQNGQKKNEGLVPRMCCALAGGVARFPSKSKRQMNAYTYIRTHHPKLLTEHTCTCIDLPHRWFQQEKGSLARSIEYMYLGLFPCIVRTVYEKANLIKAALLLRLE